MDGGIIWEYKGLKESKNIHRIIIDESRPGTVYVGAQGTQWGKSAMRGVFKTTNGGENWNKTLYVNDGVGIAELVVDPTNPNKLIAAMWEFGRTPAFFNSGGPGSGLHITYDGGLTIDATNAENNTTIIAIAPSPLDKKVIWVGTDDGNIQLTRNGGQTWTKLNSRMPGLPKAAWIPQIEVSTHNAGEAFVVINNYRQNDWSGYLYHTMDYGNSWRRIVDASDVSSFVTSVAQDHEEPNLLFLGTDTGLYISFDKGGKWTKWENGLPSVQIRDMKIQKSFDDLVFGTFGRAFWVLDDIGPFREYAISKYTNQPFAITSATDGYLTQFRSYQGIRFIGQAEYVGDNTRPDVMMSIWVKPEKVEVKLDPRVQGIKEADINDLKMAYEEMSEVVESASKGFDKLKKAKKRVKLIEKLTETLQDTSKKEITELCKDHKKKHQQINGALHGQTRSQRHPTQSEYAKQNIGNGEKIRQ